MKKKLYLLFVVVLMAVAMPVAVFAASVISGGTSAEGEISVDAGKYYEFTFSLNAPANVGFTITVASNGEHGPYSAECYIGILAANRSVVYGYHLDQLGDPDTLRRGARGRDTRDSTELKYRKEPERLSAGAYTVVISAPDYLFSREGPFGYYSTGAKVWFEFELIGASGLSIGSAPAPAPVPIPAPSQAPGSAPVPGSSQDQGSEGISIFVNGKLLQTDVPPLIIESRTMVPLRAIVEALGIPIEWESASQRVNFSVTGGNVLYEYSMQINNTSVTQTTRNQRGQAAQSQIVIDSPPVLVGGRTLVPVRFVAEAAYCNVVWDGPSKTVTISSNQFVTSRNGR